MSACFATSRIQKIIWLDWEHSDLLPDGSGTHCFDERCLEAFKSFARLPKGIRLDDWTVVGKFSRKWVEFRAWQDGQIIGKIRSLVNSLGCRFMLYSWSSNDALWGACRGKIDIAFVGLPGNRPLDSFAQPDLDARAKWYRKMLGDIPVIAQHIHSSLSLTRNGWKRTEWSWDGFQHPEEWKSGILRVACAGFRGLDISTANLLGGGGHYYAGEATRIIARFEDMFLQGKRADRLASSQEVTYPNLLVLVKDGERLVFVFNEDDEAKKVRLNNHSLPPASKAVIVGPEKLIRNPGTMTLVIPPRDVGVIHILSRAH